MPTRAVNSTERAARPCTEAHVARRLGARPSFFTLRRCRRTHPDGHRTRLRAYWTIKRPAPWLFPGWRGPLSIRSAQRVYRKATAEAGITRKGRHPHAASLLRHPSPRGRRRCPHDPAPTSAVAFPRAHPRGACSSGSQTPATRISEATTGSIARCCRPTRPSAPGSRSPRAARRRHPR